MTKSTLSKIVLIGFSALTLSTSIQAFDGGLFDCPIKDEESSEVVSLLLNLDKETHVVSMNFEGYPELTIEMEKESPTDSKTGLWGKSKNGYEMIDIEDNKIIRSKIIPHGDELTLIADIEGEKMTIECGSLKSPERWDAAVKEYKVAKIESELADLKSK